MSPRMSTSTSAPTWSITLNFQPMHASVQIDLDAGRVPLPDASAETVVAVETIEHLENPRAFFRELFRLAKPGGTVLVTTREPAKCVESANLSFKKAVQCVPTSARFVSGAYHGFTGSRLITDRPRKWRHESRDILQWSRQDTVHFRSLAHQLWRPLV